MGPKPSNFRLDLALLCYPRTSEANGRNSSKRTRPLVVVAKTLKMAKICFVSKNFEKCFRIGKIINIQKGLQKSFAAPNNCYIIKSIKIKTELQTLLSLGSVMNKNDSVHEIRRRSKPFLVIYCDMKILSFEFCNDIFI